MIIVRCCGGKLFVATGAGALFGGRNPSGTMPATDVDNEVGLHLTGVIATGTVPESGSFGWMGLHHVLLEPGFLDEGLAAAGFGTNVV